MKSTKVQKPRLNRNKCGAEVEKNCLVAEYRVTVLHRIVPRTIMLIIIATSDASKVRRADRGKPVLICFFALLHAITFERSIFTKNSILKIKPVWH